MGALVGLLLKFLETGNFTGRGGDGLLARGHRFGGFACGFGGGGLDAALGILDLREQGLHRAFDRGQRGEPGVARLEPPRQFDDLVLERFDCALTGLRRAGGFDAIGQVPDDSFERLACPARRLGCGRELLLDLFELMLRAFRDLPGAARLMHGLIDLGRKRFELLFRVCWMRQVHPAVCETERARRRVGREEPDWAAARGAVQPVA